MMKKEEALSSETLIPIYDTTRCYIPEDDSVTVTAMSTSSQQILIPGV
jgi:hypothetical protein